MPFVGPHLGRSWYQGGAADNSRLSKYFWCIDIHEILPIVLLDIPSLYIFWGPCSFLSPPLLLAGGGEGYFSNCLTRFCIAFRLAGPNGPISSTAWLNAFMRLSFHTFMQAEQILPNKASFPHLLHLAISFFSFLRNFTEYFLILNRLSPFYRYGILF